MTTRILPSGRILCFYTNPVTGKGTPAHVIWASEDGGRLVIDLINQKGEWMVTAGDLYCEDESGRFLGGPQIEGERVETCIVKIADEGNRPCGGEVVYRTAEQASANGQTYSGWYHASGEADHHAVPKSYI